MVAPGFVGAGRRNEGETTHGSIANGILAHEGHECGIAAGSWRGAQKLVSSRVTMCEPGARQPRSLIAPPETVGLGGQGCPRFTGSPGQVGVPCWWGPGLAPICHPWQPWVGGRTPALGGPTLREVVSSASADFSFKTPSAAHGVASAASDRCLPCPGLPGAFTHAPISASWCREHQDEGAGAGAGRGVR